MSKTVVSSFGTFTTDELDTLKKGMRELSDVYTMQEAQRDTVKSIIDELYQELKIPKKLIRKISKTYHKQNFSEVVAEQQELELFFEGIVDQNQP
jgi:putative protein kinase ArgK-like GTPase of G3E family